MEIYQASKTFLPANAGLPPLVNYIRRTVEETDSRKLLPIIPRSLDTINDVDLQAGFTAMRSNKLEDGVAIFTLILQSLLVNVVGSQAQVDQAKALIAKATEYTLAMKIELERRKLATSGDNSEASLKRQLELSAYFTVPKLDVAHRQLALMQAMKNAFSSKQFSSSLSFANRILANNGAPKHAEQVCSPFPMQSILTDGPQAKRVKQQAERSGSIDKVDIEYDQFADFDICAASFTPVYGCSQNSSCPFDGAKYHSQYKGEVCRICEVCEIGAPASGLRLWIQGL